MDDAKLLVDVVQEAGEIGLKYFKKDPEVWIKGKNSPVSEADYAIDRFLKKTLLNARPDYGWLSEESEDDLSRLKKKRVFIVDPIDGTRGFLQETENWMISIAIVEDGRPIVGVLLGPVMERLYVATHNKGASLNGQAISACGESDETQPIAGPDNVLKFIEDVPYQKARYVHSLAYRMALVADGEFQAAIAKPRAHDWDVAAADLILQEAGAHLYSAQGKAPLYNRQTTTHGWLIAAHKTLYPALQKAALRAIKAQ